MNLYINNYLSGIEVINSTLQTQKNSLTNERVEKIMSNLDQLLHDLEHHVKKEVFTALTEPLKPWIVEVLQTVHQTLNLYADGRLEKIESIKHKILDLQSIVEIHPVFKINPPLEDVVGIAYFCDLQVPDHNGGIGWSMRQAIMQNIPFVTTRSMLHASGRVGEDGLKALDNFMKMQKIIYSCRNKWDIYQNGEVFVFIPLIAFRYLKCTDRLEALDLRSDGKLKRCPVEAIYEKAPVKSTIHDVIDVFASQATAKTIFYAFGHGGSNFVAALCEEDYRIFLDFLSGRHCKGLVISSCCAGGKSSLLNIKEKLGDGPAGFLDQQKSHPFPILVRSFGDFTTYTEQPAEVDLREFLDEFSCFVQGKQTFSQLRQVIRNIESGQKKDFVNLIKFYPAHSAGIPGGFRPLNESESAFSLTYNEVKKAEIGPVISKNFKGTSNPGSIIVRNAGMLEIHPLVISLPIVFEKHNPVLFSMTPGHAHHFIKALTHTHSFSVRSPLDFIRKTIDYHKKDFRYASKGFFIGEIRCNDKALTGVALKLTPQEAICTGKGEDGNYFFSTDGKAPIVITPFLHGMICHEIMQTTRSEEKAIISMSGGQESEREFEEAVREGNLFSLDFQSVFNMDDTLFFDYMKNQVQPQDQEAAVIFLLESREVARAFKLYKSLDLDPEMKKFTGTPLLFAAVQVNAVDMVRHLLQQGADINVPNASSRPLLNHAIVWLADAYKKGKGGNDNAEEIADREEILDLLLEHPELNLGTLNSLGWTAVPNALADHRIMEKLIAKGAKIDHCHKNGWSLVSALIATRDIEELNVLLAFKPDPNLGSPTALSYAFKANNSKLIKNLLDIGGEPFKQDILGKVPFIDAIFWTSADVLERLLEREDCNLEIEEKNGMFPLLAALLIGNEEKICMLKRAKFIFPIHMSKEAESYFQNVLERYIQMDDEDAITDLLAIGNVPHILVAEQLLKKYKEPFLKRLLNLQVIDVMSLSTESLAKLEAYETLSWSDGETNVAQKPVSNILTRSM